MALLRRKKKAPEATNAEAAGAEASGALDKIATSPNPMTNLILADIALRVGETMLKRGVETGILGQSLGAKKAAKVIKGRSLGQSLLGTALARMATRSIPGAIVIGGGLVAKTLYDRRKGKAAKEDGRAAIEKRARKAK